MASPDKPLQIDIPVHLDDVKAVFSVAALAFEGDLPASIIHLQWSGVLIAAPGGEPTHLRLDTQRGGGLGAFPR